MAKTKVCSVQDCGKDARTKGLCSAHYRRLWRHGDPLLGNAGHGVPRKWLYDRINHVDKEHCLIWPYSRTTNGYATVRIADGKLHTASRLMCQRAHGDPPATWYWAAHTCGNGHIGCVNPHHLMWKTPQGNMQDKIDHGTHGRGSTNSKSKLTEDQVRHIRSMTGLIVQQRLAEQYGVNAALISRIQAGIDWAWLK